jgi:hypothetical protein
MKFKIFIHIVFLIVFFGIICSYAGVVENSPYDKNWDIYVSSCNGATTVYYNCTITNLGQDSISFIPDQGRIPTSNGKEVIVQKGLCTSYTMVQHD